MSPRSTSRLTARAGVLAAATVLLGTSLGAPALAQEPSGPTTSVSAVVVTDDGVDVVTERVPLSEVPETKADLRPQDGGVSGSGDGPGRALDTPHDTLPPPPGTFHPLHL